MTAAMGTIARRNSTALLLAGGVLLVVALVALPVLVREGTRDWIAYQQAAERLQAGDALYVWQLATPDDEYYLYPPGLAVLWAIAGSPELLLVAKVLALAAVGVLAPLVIAEDRWRPLAAAVLVAGAMAWPPNVHDLILGNVMALYVGAIAVAIARPGWVGALPLGTVVALALKPAAGPFLLWLLLRRPADAVRVAIVAVAWSAAAAVVFGPGRYVEYLQALPEMTTLAASFTGNVGLVTLSREAAYLGIAVAYGLAVVAALRLDARAGAAVALAAMLLAQPTIGFNYAGLLFPAIALVWGMDRPLGVAAFVVAAPLMLVAPVAAAVVVIVLAFAAGWRTLGVPSRVPA